MTKLSIHAQSVVQTFLTYGGNGGSRSVIQQLLIHILPVSQHQLLLEAETLPQCLVLNPLDTVDHKAQLC